MSVSSRKIYFYNLFASLIPSTKFFKIKSFFLRKCGISLGHNVRISSSVKVMFNGNLFIGNNTWIGHQVLITGGYSTIKIGSEVDIAPKVLIVTGTHEISKDINSSKIAGSGKSLSIEIGDGSWIGANSTILGGVKIGRKSIVAAGSVVTKDIPSNVLCAGVPARIVKKI